VSYPAFYLCLAGSGQTFYSESDRGSCPVFYQVFDPAFVPVFGHLYQAIFDPVSAMERSSLSRTVSVMMMAETSPMSFGLEPNAVTNWSA
jgi:hypothetical protein